LFRVVDLAARGRLVAPAQHAVLVAGDDGTTELSGDGALGPADVQDL
jgi:hypothetical protein